MLDPNPYESPRTIDEPIRAELAEDDDEPILRMTHRTILGVALCVGGMFAAEGFVKRDAEKIALAVITCVGIGLSARQADYAAIRDALAASSAPRKPSEV